MPSLGSIKLIKTVIRGISKAEVFTLLLGSFPPQSSMQMSFPLSRQAGSSETWALAPGPGEW